MDRFDWVSYEAIIEYRREAAVFAVTSHPMSKSSGGPLSRPSLCSSFISPLFTHKPTISSIMYLNRTHETGNARAPSPELRWAAVYTLELACSFTPRKYLKKKLS
ncbi:hypothetical protein EVAR_81636_1 [Eumeta japonica]|uniref:Uncharacterized protein n=1 Tax=Eumeta variegata TaxID=151549 RepID=A0A4C1WG28_EUMVA|nr:hypothetical protein EVAR_81636_1 [Eumeta japonica]